MKARTAPMPRWSSANLLQGPAAAARFIPLYSGGDEPDAAAYRRNQCAPCRACRMPFDVVVLGMGNDGHTASFFPGGDTLDEALTDPVRRWRITAPGAGEPRVTLTLPRLLETRALYLHIEGDEKARDPRKGARRRSGCGHADPRRAAPDRERL